MVRGFLNRYVQWRLKKKYLIPACELFKYIDELVAEHIKPSAKGIPSESYDISLCAGRSYGRRTPYPEIWWDTRLGLVLLLKQEGHPDAPIAWLGFDVRRNSLRIWQVQGKEGMQDYLRPIRWERLLFKVAIQYARILKVSKVVSITAARHPYNPLANPEILVYKSFTPEQCNARAARMHLAYDKTAQKCGMEFDATYRAYVLTL